MADHDSNKRGEAPVSGASGLGWINVAGLGIAFAISGNFSGWNFGLGVGGWAGMLIAAVMMACYYLCLAQCIAELAAAHPDADGMDSYAKYGLGDAGGCFAGMSVAVAVGLATGLCVTFIEAYSASVLGIGGWPLKLALIVGFIGIQLRGAREAVGLTTAGGFFSVAVLLTFCAAMGPHFSAHNLFTMKNGTATLLPHGVFGALQCIPYALFMFLGVEQAANAAVDMREPGKHLPKALLTAVGTVLLIGLGVLLLAAGGGGVERVAASEGSPLYAAMTSKSAFGGGSWLGKIVGIGSIISLLSTMFSLTYASSRQFYSVAKAGFLPSCLVKTNAKNAPWVSLLAVSLLGTLGTSLNPDTVLVCFIFGLNVCNILVLCAFIRLRIVRPHLARPYRAIGGRLSAVVAITLSVMVLVACAGLQPTALNYVAAGYCLLGLYYLLVWRRAVAPVAAPSE